MQDIARAQAEGEYVGHKKDIEKRKIITSLVKSGHSYTNIQKTAKYSRQLIAEVSQELRMLLDSSYLPTT